MSGFFFQNQETQWSGCSSLHRMRFAVSQIKQEYHQLILLGGLVDESVFSKALEGTEASLPPATPTFKRTPLKVHNVFFMVNPSLLESRNFL